MPSLRHTLVYPLVLSVVGLVLFNAALYGLLPPAQPVPALQPASSFRLEFDHGLVNTHGWNRPQRSPDGVTYQWTNTSPATITFPVNKTEDLEVEFVVYQFINDSMASGLELRVNDHPIPLERVGKHYYAVIPATVLIPDAASVTLMFYTPPPVHPVDVNPNSYDVRALGIAFDWLELRPLSPRPL